MMRVAACGASRASLRGAEIAARAVLSTASLSAPHSNVDSSDKFGISLSLNRVVDLRSKILLLGGAQINLALPSLNRIFDFVLDTSPRQNCE